MTGRPLDAHVGGAIAALLLGRAVSTSPGVTALPL